VSSAAWSFVSQTEPQTARLGQALAQALEPGMVVALVGPLGAGKTRLVRAVAHAAGVADQHVNSPTYVLIQEYEARWPIYHFDTYRLPDSSAFSDLGAEEYLAGDGVCFVEWADRVADYLPADLLRIEIEVCGETVRRFTFSGHGPRSQQVVGQVAGLMDVEPA